MSRPHEARTRPEARRRADQPLSVPDGQLCTWCVDREPPRGHRKKLGGDWMTTAAKTLPRESRPADVREGGAGFDLEKVRRDFPILRQRVHGRTLVYLDNAATSQKPQVVINAITRYYERDNANIHRGVHFLSEHATEEHDEARATIQAFINAADPKEIIFVRGATEAINLVAQSYGRTHIGAGDEIVITAMEHHSNIVPWQFLCDEKGAKLRVAPINDAGELILDEYAKLLSPKTKR